MAYGWICLSRQQSISYTTNLAGRLSCKCQQLGNSHYNKKSIDVPLCSVGGGTDEPIVSTSRRYHIPGYLY